MSCPPMKENTDFTEIVFKKVTELTNWQQHLQQQQKLGNTENLISQITLYYLKCKVSNKQL